MEFSTFATRTILGELKRHFRDKGWFVRAPRRVQELYLEVGQAITSLTQELRRSPTIGEVAAEIGVEEADVLEALEAGQAYRSTSIDAPGPGGETLDDRLGDVDDALVGVEQREFLAAALANLPPREQRIIVLRFVDGLTQSEIAQQVGVSQMQVSRLLDRSLRKLRAFYGPESPQAPESEG